MRKRVSILVMFWLGLVWAAAPALACAQTPDRDCCPPDTHTPCSGDLQAVAAACCISAPAASPAAVADAPRGTCVQSPDTDSLDTTTLVAWFATLRPLEHEPPPLPPDAPGVRNDAALTYLHTLRLRL